MDVQNNIIKDKKISPSLRTNFFWTLFGNIIYMGSQWGILVIIAKITKSAMVGQYTLGLAITAPIFMLFNLQLRSVQATDALNKYFFSDYLSLRIITSTIAFAIVIIVAFIWKNTLTAIYTIILIGFSKVIESISDVFYGMFQQKERMDLIAKSMILKGILTILMLGSFIFISKQVFWGIIALILTWSYILIFYDIKNGKLINNINCKIDKKIDILTIKKLILLSLPLGIVMMLLSLNTNIPRYFLERKFGDSVLGIYSAIAYLTIIGNNIITALGQSISSRLSKYYASKDIRKYLKLLFVILSLALILGILGLLISWFFGKKLLTFLYGREYADNSIIFTSLMVVAIFQYIASSLGYGMTAARYFKIQLPLFLFTTICTLFFCRVFIPKYSLYGAVLSQGISSIIQMLLSSIVILNAIKKREGNYYSG
ncbi:MAG: lipopolysaccharide biosynthesis protein [Bacillota bacterium]